MCSCQASKQRENVIDWLTTDWKCTLCKIKQPGDFLRLYEILRTEQEDIIRGLMHFNLFCTLIRLFVHTHNSCGNGCGESLGYTARGQAHRPILLCWPGCLSEPIPDTYTWSIPFQIFLSGYPCKCLLNVASTTSSGCLFHVRTIICVKMFLPQVSWKSCPSQRKPLVFDSLHWDKDSGCSPYLPLMILQSFLRSSLSVLSSRDKVLVYQVFLFCWTQSKTLILF